MKKKLHIIFDKPIKLLDIGQDDAFIHDKACMAFVKGGDCVYTFSLMAAAHDKRPAAFLDKVFADENDVCIVENTLYGNLLLQVYSFLTQLTEIITAKSYDSIVLYGGSKYVYLSFERSEGEGTPYHYCHSWLFNAIAYQYIKQNGYSIEWLDRHCSFLLQTHNMFREIVLKFLEFQKSVLQCVKNRNEGVVVSDEDRDGTEIVALVKIEGQYNYINKLLEQTGKKFSIISPYRYSEKALVLKDYLSIKDIIKFHFGRKKARINGEGKYLFFVFNNREISISRKAFSRAVDTTYLLYLNAIKRVKNKIDKAGFRNLQYCVTCAVYGRSMMQYTEALKSSNFKHINVQYVAMGQRDIPIKKMADEYYLFEKGALQFYSERCDFYRFFMPVFAVKDKVLRTGVKPVVVIYTQPDSFSPKYINMLKQLFIILGQDLNKIELIIKLHYRQDCVETFMELANSYGVEVIKNQKSVLDLMKSSDVCVSMTSAILFEATFYKVPAIMYWEDDLTYNYHLENGTGFPNVNYVVRNVSQLKKMILDFDVEDYNRRYENYLKENNSYTLKEIFE